MVDQSKLKQLDIASPYYPTEWKTLKDAPRTLYYTGDPALLTTRKLTVVGSRTTPANALKIGAQAAKALSETFTIVTGTADGGDTAAIEGALAGSGKVICVLAGGFSALPQNNLPLLREVAKKGLLLSPHPFDTPVRNFSYEYRNKLLATLGEGAFVLGAAEKSGALITAKYALAQNKPVFALPYAPNIHAGAGCNALIKKGARLTESAEDIFEAFDIKPAAQKPQIPLSPDEEKILLALRELSEAHISELSQRSGVPVFRAMAILSALEVKGVVASLGGNRYAPV